MAKLSASNLKKSYRKRQVVNGVSVGLDSGEVTGLLGPNGAGKTTCFYMIAGLIRPDNGTITINGKNITHTPVHARAKEGLGYLPQEASVFRKLSVAENIMAVLERRVSLDRSARHKMLDQLLEEFGIGHVKSTMGMSLSGGERRRVEIARSLAMDPSFILLDEPFAGVDPISVSDIKQIVIHLKNRGIGVLITDHNVRETLDICDHAYIMSEGAIIAQGDSKAIMENQKVRDVYLGEHFTI